MKTIIRAFIYLLMIAVSTGCSTTEKFTVSAPIGTKITLPMDGLVEPQPKIMGGYKVTIPSEGYCGYVLATPAGSTTPIPLGLDLKRKSHHGTKASLGAAYVLSSIGVCGMIGGTIIVIGANSNGDDDASSTAALVVCGSAALTGVGAGMGIASQSRLRQTAYDYSFGYDNRQQLNIPHLSTTLLHPNPEKNAPQTNGMEKSTRKKASSGKTVEVPSAKGSRVSKSRAASANKIAGNYIGTGQLLRNKRQEDFYSNIEIEVSAVDKNSVKVRIIESGEDFFEEPLIYTVSTDKKGDYQLKIDDIPEATITITKAGALSFTHPKVNIDDVMYNLIIKAKRN